MRSLGGQNIFSEFGSLEKYTKPNVLVSEKRRILVVSGKNSFEKSGAKLIINSNLDSQIVCFFNDFSANPKLEDAVRGALVAEEYNIDCIIAIGGGSAIDMAKIIKALIKQTHNAVRLVRGELDLDIKSDIELVAIPTTSGTGSESTHFAVVYIDGEKFSLASAQLLPQNVLLDGSLAISATSYQKACCILDALAQAIEGGWSRHSDAEVRAMALPVIEKLVEAGIEYVKGSEDGELVQSILVSSNLSGQIINRAKTTSAHAWSYGFTSTLGLPHGHAIWLTLPRIFKLHKCYAKTSTNLVLNRFLDSVIQIFAKFPGENIEERLKLFCKRLGVETDFKKLSICKNQREFISRAVNVERLSNNPILFSCEDVKKIFEI